MGKPVRHFLSFRLLHLISGLLLPGKLVGSLADFLHGLNIRAHGFHLLIQSAVLGGEAFRFGLPMLGRNLRAGRFQFVQIPHGSVIQGKFRAVRILKLFSRSRFQSGKTLANRLAVGILLPHGKPLVQSVDLAGSGGNLAAHTLIFCLHSGDFRVKLLHGRNAVSL